MSNRAWQIARVAARHRLDTLLSRDLLDSLGVPAWQRLLLAINPVRLISTGNRSDGQRLRAALTELGPVYIKLGQLLSTRPDVVPEAIARELAALQDTVPPIPAETAVRIIEAEFGASLQTLFDHFDHVPLAAASIAQVHAARLPDGADVVVKVVRPDLSDAIDADMSLFRRLAAHLRRRYPAASRLRLDDVLDDYHRTISAELDMQAEAANTARLRGNFADSELLYVPRVYRHLCGDRVLVMERIHGVPVSHVDELEARGVDLALLADRGVRTFFTQVFEDNFFHADMHPGNVYVDVRDPADPRYIALDCAIMGTLTERDQEYLARNLLAFFNRDYAEVARLHVVSGWVPAGTDAAAFEAVIREVCEPIFEKPLAEISFGNFLMTLFQTAERFQMEVQPQLVLLQKTLLYIEGLGRALYPQLDLWNTAQPFMERWLLQHLGPAAQLQRFAENLPEMVRSMNDLPAELARLREAHASLAHSVAGLQHRPDTSAPRWRQLLLAGIAGALIAAAVLG